MRLNNELLAKEIKASDKVYTLNGKSAVTGLTYQTVWNVANMKTKDIGVETFLKLCLYTGRHPTYYIIDAKKDSN